MEIIISVTKATARTTAKALIMGILKEAILILASNTFYFNRSPSLLIFKLTEDGTITIQVLAYLKLTGQLNLLFLSLKFSTEKAWKQDPKKKSMSSTTKTMYQLHLHTEKFLILSWHGKTLISHNILCLKLHQLNSKNLLPFRLKVFILNSSTSFVIQSVFVNLLGMSGSLYFWFIYFWMHQTNTHLFTFLITNAKFFKFY